MKLKYLIIASSIIVSISFAQGFKTNSLVGSWYKQEKKLLNSNIIIKVTKKEQFFKNGSLLSTKWFNFKTKDGKDLGEYYITKLFRWQANKNVVRANFYRCQTGVTKALRVKQVEYRVLSRQCRLKKYSNKVTIKPFRVINDKLYLGNKDIFTKL